MKYLIVNGDDFGLTAGVNAGILRAYREGILRSASLMANGPAFIEAVELARQHPGLDIGCHLVLVDGQPVSPPERIPSLVQPDGRLPRTVRHLVVGMLTGSIRKDDLLTEARAQVERLLAAGVRPSHLDTHKHTHLFPPVLDVVVRTAVEFGIGWIRCPYEPLGELLGREAGPQNRRSITAALAGLGRSQFERKLRQHGLHAPHRLSGFRLTGVLTPQHLRRIIERLPDGITELVCHPGLYDSELEAIPTRLKHQREHELQTLLAPEVQQAVTQAAACLCSFRDLETWHEHISVE
jgi:hopanoid biosynthesis associated protein HpnK